MTSKAGAPSAGTVLTSILPAPALSPALKLTSAGGLLSLWKLWCVAVIWTILGCATVIHRRSPGSWLMANSRAPGYVTVISAPLRSSHRTSTPSGQLQLPCRPRYIHRGSCHRFVLFKHGDPGNHHQSITTLWSAERTVAQKWHHQNAATPFAKDRGSGGLLVRKPGMDRSALCPLDWTPLAVSHWNYSMLSH